MGNILMVYGTTRRAPPGIYNGGNREMQPRQCCDRRLKSVNTKDASDK